MQEVFDFAWQVATGGYQWVQTEAAPAPFGTEEKGWFLTACTPPFTARRYAPLQQYPTLFRTFIETPPMQEGILAFANRYGMLGGNISTHIILPNKKGAQGELLKDWQEELSYLKRAVTLWDMVEAGNVEGLARHIIWKETEDKEKKEKLVSVSYDSHPELPLDQAPPGEGEWHISASIATSREPELLSRFQPGDVGQPALYYVQKVVNDHLTGRLSPRLLWNQERTQLGLYMAPNGLIGALWLQFAQAISGNKRYHQCEYCGTWFEVSLEASRPTRVYCSDACRFKAYRKRQEDAYQLNQQGIPLKEIAKRLGTNTATAKGWIKKRKEA